MLDALKTIEPSSISRLVKRSPLIVELVGPPGVGKTTFAEMMQKRSKKIFIGSTPYFRKIEYVPFFIKHTLLMLPTFFRIQPNKEGKWLTKYELAYMVVLRGWHHLLRRKRSKGEMILVLDEGPICILANLIVYASDSLKSQSAKFWWEHMYRHWAKVLDVAIRFDTPDKTLVQRIRLRDMWQEVKVLPNRDAFNYLDRVRDAQGVVLTALTSNSRGPKVLNFNTWQKSPEQIYVEVAKIFDLEQAGDCI
jgi:broad-specificity NMP kinase